ncbi:MULTISPECIES: hypothetical protein [unclassified Streptomyces]|uniref:hypothetical protein n=1 Tax=unclassified Streptomyces TaxID=2593676 RepID=UPI002024141C|nr:MULTISPECIES: hypothetical protein [unclassified Streptomyces]MCX4549035.1 hypothetical protein [Streptomyces sp. NBC_01500]
MKAVRFAAATGCVLLAVGCGPSGKQAASPSSSRTSATRPAPAVDKGPVCAGDRGAKGIHVLRGGSVQLPGGAGSVLYREARSDGSARTAVLTNGTGPGAAAAGTRDWTVKPGQALTVGRASFTVAQICTYRVVLTPKGQKNVTSSPPPSSEATWPSLTDGRFRLRWHIPNNEYSGQYSAVVTEINPGPRADIGIASRDGGDASYPDARVGDTLEFAGRLWKVSAIEAGDGSPAGSNPHSGYVDLQLIGPAGG